MSAVIGQAAADEHGRRQLIELRQLADGVEDDDVGARLGIDRQLGPARWSQTPRRAPAARLLRTARDGGAPVIASAPGVVVLIRANARSTAASSPCTVLPATITTRPGATRKNRSTLSRGLACETRSASRSESNFRLPVTVTRDGSAPRSISRRADSSLCMQKRSTSASTRRKNGRIQPVARIGARRNPPVDDDGLDAAVAADPQQVRPDLGLHHHEQPRLHDVQRAADDERPVEREIEDGVDVLQAAPRDLLSGDRRGRQEQPEARIARLQVGGERARRQRLADRDGVDPDRLFAVDVERDRQVDRAAAAGCRCTSCDGPPDTGNTARQ